MERTFKHWNDKSKWSVTEVFAHSVLATACWSVEVNVLTVVSDFGLTYARRGELLDYIKRLGCFDENCTRFYIAEVTEALEYLHSIGIIHRYCIFTLCCFNSHHYRGCVEFFQ